MNYPYYHVSNKMHCWRGNTSLSFYLLSGSVFWDLPCFGVEVLRPPWGDLLLSDFLHLRSMTIICLPVLSWKLTSSYSSKASSDGLLYKCIFHLNNSTFWYTTLKWRFRKLLLRMLHFSATYFQAALFIFLLCKEKWINYTPLCQRNSLHLSQFALSVLQIFWPFYYAICNREKSSFSVLHKRIITMALHASIQITNFVFHTVDL